MAIDWQSVVTRLDAEPATTTSAGRAVLTRLISAGRAYDTAGKPDVLHESEAHQEWASLRPSQRLGRTEPAYYVGAYYTRFRARSSTSAELLQRRYSAETIAKRLPADARTAYYFWLPKDPAIAHRIARYYVAQSLEAERDAALAKAPTLGAIETGLVSAVAAAEAFLEAN